MPKKRLGEQTFALPSKPRVASWASMVGKKEGEGPLAHTFDQTFTDDTLGEKSWEKAETKMLTQTVQLCLKKANLPLEEVQLLLGGDLLNQIISASFTARQLAVPFLGLYGACSTMAESLMLGGLLIDGGFVDNAVCSTCSHFSTAERQYRFPLELGNQRAPASQWTVTGAGATLLAANAASTIAVESVTIGKVVDLGQTDADNMGAAMAPAAADTLLTHLKDTGRSVDYYDRIVTGDLGHVGYDLMKELSARNNLTLDSRYIDCGCEIFLPEQGVQSGGSGCGCSATVLNGWLLGQMKKGEIKRMLFMATGALLSTTSTQQGESIPGIAHAVSLEATV